MTAAVDIPRLLAPGIRVPTPSADLSSTRTRSLGSHERLERHGVEEGAEQQAHSPVIGDLEELLEEVPRPRPGVAGRLASRASWAGGVVEEETNRLQQAPLVGGADDLASKRPR